MEKSKNLYVQPTHGRELRGGNAEGGYQEEGDKGGKLGHL